MLEAVYEERLCHELAQAGIGVERKVGIPVIYRGVEFGEGFRADIPIERQVVAEIKAVANFVPAHDAQVLTYLRMSGLLFSFHARLLKRGVRRSVI